MYKANPRHPPSLFPLIRAKMTIFGKSFEILNLMAVPLLGFDRQSQDQIGELRCQIQISYDCK